MRARKSSHSAAARPGESSIEKTTPPPEPPRNSDRARPDVDPGDHYRRLFEYMHEGCFLAEIVCDDAGRAIDYRYLAANPALEPLTGLKRDDIIGRTVREVLPGVEDYWIETYGRVALTGIPERVENFAAPLGRYYSTVAYATGSGRFACLFTDITERRKAELETQALLAAVREEKERLATLVNSISDEVWLCDLRRQFTLVNPPALRAFGIAPSAEVDVEKLARSLEVLRPDGTERPVEQAPPLRALSGEIVTAEEEIIRIPSTGELRYREVNASPIRNAAGEIIGSVSIVRDVTDRKRAEERLAHQAAIVAGVARIFREGLGCETETELGRVCVAVAEEVTQSAFGFVAEINEATGRLDDIAISDPGWDACAMDVAPGRKVLGGFQIHGLYGAVIQGRTSFFTNDPASHADSIGTPGGHPPLTAFLGVPLFVGDKVIGMVGLGNRDGGYRLADVEAVEALAPAIVQALLYKRAEQASRNTTERFQTILDHAPVAIYVKDRDGRYVFANREVERFTGRSVEALLGKTDYDFAPKDDADRWRENDAKVLEHGHVSEFEESGCDALGHPYVNLSLKFPLTDDSGAPVAICGMSTDISDRKHAEEALRAANEQLVESDRRKDEFLAILSHELRNPLAPVRYSLPLLAKAALTDDAATALDVIDRQLAHLTRLVDDLLDISRITTNKIELRSDYVTVRTVVRTAIEAAAPAVAAGSHSLTVDIPDEPLWVHGDAARLSQVVTNLLDNSAKYTPRGGQLAVVVSSENDQAVIRVRDNGMGIPARDLPAVFDMFHQVDRPDKGQGGLGIGLALVKRLTQMHGGSVEAHSVGVGQGAEFVVRLPLTPSAPGAPVAGTRPASAGTRLRVLVADDNVDLVTMFAVFVESLGHDVRKAFDGPSAISAARSYRPDVVFLDLGMPGVPGLEVARALRRHEETAGAYLVALTGWGQAHDRQATREAGFDEHLTKPTGPDEVEALLARIADSRRRSEGATS